MKTITREVNSETFLRTVWTSAAKFWVQNPSNCDSWYLLAVCVRARPSGGAQGSGWWERQREAWCGERSFGCTDRESKGSLNATVEWFYSAQYSILEQERSYFASQCKQQKDAETGFNEKWVLKW